MAINVKLLKQICEVAGAPGREQRVREIVLKEVLTTWVILQPLKKVKKPKR